MISPNLITNSREEIRRLKAENPKMTHKEAFSTAAKNVSFSKDLILSLFFSRNCKPS